MRLRRGRKKPRLETSSDEEDEAQRERVGDLVQKLPCYQGQGSLTVDAQKSVEEDKRQLEEERMKLREEIQKFERVKNKVKEENAKLEEEKNQLQQEKAKVEEIKLKAEEDKLKVEEDRLKVEEERVRVEKLSKVLQSQVECPVCLTLPREDKAVPCCPRGHIVCSACRDKSIRQGKLDCPTCRVPMGQGQSLLALTVIENVQHECGHQGCGMKLNLDKIKEHEETCDWRLIPCPGRGFECNAMTPLCNVITHARGCPGCRWPEIQASVEGRVEEFLGVTSIKVGNVGTQGTFSWPTNIFETKEGQFFFVRFARIKGIYKVDVVMKGSLEDCEDFMVEASILNVETRKPVYKSLFQPRPLTDQNEAIFCLSVPDRGLSKAWKFDENAGAYHVLCSVKIVKNNMYKN